MDVPLYTVVACDRCKRGKRKCVPLSETTPIPCTRCHRLGVSCTRNRPPKPRRSSATASHAGPAPAPSSSSSSSSASSPASPSSIPGRALVPLAAGSQAVVVRRKRRAADVEEEDGGGGCSVGDDGARVVRRGRGMGWVAPSGAVVPVVAGEYADAMLAAVRQSMVVIPGAVADAIRAHCASPAFDATSALVHPPASPVLDVLARVVVAGGAAMRGDVGVARLAAASALGRVGEMFGTVSPEAALTHLLLGLHALDTSSARTRTHIVIANDILDSLATRSPSLFPPLTVVSADTSAPLPSTQTPISILFGRVVFALRTYTLRVDTRAPATARILSPLFYAFIRNTSSGYPLFVRGITTSLHSAASRSAANVALLHLSYLGEVPLDISSWTPAMTPASAAALDAFFVALPSVPPPPEPSPSDPIIRAAVEDGHHTLHALIDAARVHTNTPLLDALLFVSSAHLAIAIYTTVPRAVALLTTALKRLAGAPRAIDFMLTTPTVTVRAQLIVIWAAVAYNAPELYSLFHTIFRPRNSPLSRYVIAAMLLADTIFPGVADSAPAEPASATTAPAVSELPELDADALGDPLAFGDLDLSTLLSPSAAALLYSPTEVWGDGDAWPMKEL